ncbi:general stress protein [Aeribacillus pallidus]|nr:general stress protein [Aeribacillus pallidus]
MRGKLEKRFFYLYTGEAMAAVIFFIISFIWNKVFAHLHLYSLYSFWISFFLLEFLLFQGSVYWFAKWKRLKKENTAITPAYIVQRLKNIKKWNTLFIIISPFMLFVDLVRWYPSVPATGLYIAGFIYVFAILEYINYFHIQLSYDNFSDMKYLLKSKKLKKSCLRKDFERLG